ncbi:SGNH/GDSL hydrolase family protein [Rhizobium sp. CNPSo 4039]|uniref:SGNH/GDSL hydrolase family protein n=1 Tax=Rhizobium sp. CNPSo 4039 TaxID=3021409 RepID=UPI00254DA38E|nr:SGNH/GDSL hydrolase family protein [Rhizobium sp. CNPSo 4039]MDK4712980.1 SGNH/GDSL hydrolase family protein [Rhizobium sp. CNPSo 4039]
MTIDRRLIDYLNMPGADGIPLKDALVEIGLAPQEELDSKVDASSVGAANGIASLDSGGKVPAAQLPSYVDEVLEFANLAGFPAIGETGKIYIALDTNFEYRWSGSTYIRLVPSPGTTDALVEGSSNLYFTAARVLATVLSGLSTATSAAITATDTVLSAFGKLQAQITSLTGTVNNKLDATGTAAAATKLATARNINGVPFDGTSDITVADSTKEPAISAGTTAQYWRGDKSWQPLNKAAVGLGNVDNTADAAKPVSSAQQTALDAKVNTSAVGVANGVASLDSGGKVPAAQLPSYVDDVLEFANLGAFPATGETGKIYIALDTNFEYRWSGSTYIRLVASPGTTDALVEGSSNLYFTAARVLATVLSGLSTATSVAITATDTVLSAFGKLQAQITSLTGTVNNKLDVTGTAAAATKLATARTINGVSFDGTANITIADSTKEPAISAGTTAQYWRGDKSWQTLNKAAVGLGNVDNTADSAKPVSTAQQAALDAKVNTSAVGVANGIASLDSGGKVPAAQLPSYVDDVLEFANLASFPAIGESGKIYIALDTNFEYRWSGSTYVRLVASPGTTDALVEGSSNLYFTAARVLATVLSGLSTSTNTAITATDTVLSAFGKLQAQVTSLLTSLAPAPSAGTKGYQPSVNAAGNAYVLKRPIEGLDPETFNAAGNGTGDDLTALTSAQSNAGYGKPIALRGDYLVSSYSNPYGNIWKGTGRILTAVTGGYWQRNTYADIQRLHIGHEYLNRCYQYIRLGQGASSGTMKIVLFGDSTIQGGFGEDQKAEVAISNALFNRGLPNHVIYNQGVSGTKWGDLSALSFLSNANALFIIKYGINDAGYGLAQLASDMDAKLSAIRAATHGGIDELAILLVGPNSTNDSPNSRDERWYEQIRGIYVAAARKHRCAYFDTYAHFQDSRAASTLWLDNSFGDLRGIHPIQAFNARIWGSVIDEFFGLGTIAPYQANAVSNEGAVSTTLTASTAPGNFNYVMRLNRAPLSSGWPIDGFVRTCKNIDGGIIQEIWSFAAGVTRKLTRTANLATNSWNRWTGVGEAISLTGGWSAYGAPWKDPTATLTEEGIVVVEGLMKGSTTAAGTWFGTLPSGMWPTADLLFDCMANGANVKVRIEASTGKMYAWSALDGTFTSLTGISFLAA